MYETAGERLDPYQDLKCLFVVLCDVSAERLTEPQHFAET